nr:MAG TPA: hypothetical protein [Caudoviricetes sp.]
MVRSGGVRNAPVRYVSAGRARNAEDWKVKAWLVW